MSGIDSNLTASVVKPVGTAVPSVGQRTIISGIVIPSIMRRAYAERPQTCVGDGFASGGARIQSGDSTLRCRVSSGNRGLVPAIRTGREAVSKKGLYQ
jgi:hypothetical protein